MWTRHISLLLRGQLSLLQLGCQQTAGIARLAAAAPFVMLCHTHRNADVQCNSSSRSCWLRYSSSSSNTGITNAGGSDGESGSAASAAGGSSSSSSSSSSDQVGTAPAANHQQQHVAAPPAQRQQRQQQPQAAAAAYGPRKITPRSGQASAGAGPAKREGIVHINSTFNNTIMVLTDRDSKVQTWTSGGTVGYKNANKATPMAAELAAKELASRAANLGFHSVVVKLKGMGKNKQFAVQSLAANGLTVTQLQDVTPIPYNGCRLPRRRRV